MVAVAEDLLDRGGFARIGQALRGPDVVRAFEISIDVAMELYAQEDAVGQALLSLAARDRHPTSAAARHNIGRPRGMRKKAERVQAPAGLRHRRGWGGGVPGPTRGVPPAGGPRRGGTGGWAKRSGGITQ